MTVPGAFWNTEFLNFQRSIRRLPVKRDVVNLSVAKKFPKRTWVNRLERLRGEPSREEYLHSRPLLEFTFGEVFPTP